MAGSLVNNYSQLDSNILEMQLTLDQTRKGMHAVSLTNYDNTSLPAIAAGSVIEVDGALYKFASEEAIGGSPSDGAVYIKIIPSTITAEFTNTAPTWSDSKNGWYGTTTSATHRYLEFKMTKATASYSNKRRFMYEQRNSVNIFGYSITDQRLAVKFITIASGAGGSGSSPHGITSAYTNKLIVGHTIFFDTGATMISQTTAADLYTFYDNTNFEIRNGYLNVTAYVMLIYKI